MATLDVRSNPDLGPGPARGAAGPLLGAALVALGLMAGTFYSYSISVMLGLAKTDDRTFVTAMQRINQAIQNVAFGPVFVGAFAFTGLAALAQRRLGARDAARWIVAGLALYAVALLVTFGVNVPLNERLARAGDPALVNDLAAVRRQFETPWVVANGARSIAGTLALGCVGRALVLHGRAAARREALTATGRVRPG